MRQRLVQPEKAAAAVTALGGYAGPKTVAQPLKGKAKPPALRLYCASRKNRCSPEMVFVYERVAPGMLVNAPVMAGT